jgi:hypothetical protein
VTDVSAFRTEPDPNESVLQAIIVHLVNAGAKAEEDARWIVRILPCDLQPFFRAEVLAAIRAKASDPKKARKIFLSLGKTARAIFGHDFALVKKQLNAESRANQKEPSRM